MPETLTMADNPQTQTEEKTPPPQAAAPKPAPKKEEAPRPRKSLGRRMREHPIKLLVFLVILAGVAYGGLRLWNYFDSYESTDDAQIDGDIYAITSRVAGTIKAVHVEDNQAVKAGDLLVELDPADYDVALSQTKAALSESESQVAVARPNVPLTSTTTETTLATSATAIAQARAAVAQARAAIASSQRDYDSAVADTRKAEADSARAQADLERYKQLIAKDEISKQQYDTAEAAAKSAAANVDAKRATAEAAQRTIEENQAKLEENQSRLEDSQTRQVEARTTRPQRIAIQDATVKSREASAARQRTLVDQAVLNLTYTKIFAPVDGIIGKKNAEPGQQIAAGQQLMADVPVGNIWVTANFKETQLKRMKPNQRVTIHVDSYDRDYEGYVESVAGATGARFSLLPPENATGNYVKVVQRVPVRIRFKEGQDPNHQLRPGMSVDPKVWLE